MPAYLLVVEKDCAEKGCTRRATVEVRNGANAPQGRYCRPHGEALVKAINAT